jgi:hypothetical protein
MDRHALLVHQVRQRRVGAESVSIFDWWVEPITPLDILLTAAGMWTWSKLHDWWNRPQVISVRRIEPDEES